MCAAFLPPCVLHLYGCTTVRCLVKRCNPRIVMPFAVKMQHVRRIATRLAKIAVSLAKCTAIRIPAQIQRQTIKVRHVFLSKSGAQILQIVAFFLTYTICINWNSPFFAFFLLLFFSGDNSTLLYSLVPIYV